MVPWGRLPTTLKPLSSTSPSDTDIDTYLRLAVMSLEAAHYGNWNGGVEGSRTTLSVRRRGSLPITLQGELASANSKVPQSSLIAELEQAHPAVCIQSLGKGRAISILLPARRVALMQINYHIRFTLLSSTDWLPNCFRWPSLILSIG